MLFRHKFVEADGEPYYRAVPFESDEEYWLWQLGYIDYVQSGKIDPGSWDFVPGYIRFMKTYQPKPESKLKARYN
jgi:hypothetical protein